MRPLLQRPIRPEEFRLLRDLVNSHAGLHFEDDARVTFARRLGERLDALELSSFGDYYKYLRFNIRGQAELEEAVERLTTHETYFFRQDYQLRSFAEELLPRLQTANERRRRLILWSAGCSTGEEAYTLAIQLHQSGLFQGWDARVIGSDVSRASVATARRAVYSGSAFRTTPPEILRNYFVPEGSGYRVVDPIRRMCHFGQLNLLNGMRSTAVGRVDVVFCRNVLIYFDVRSKRRVIDNLADRLVPGGYLLLGHSESLINVSTAFELVHLREDLVYRKPQSSWGDDDHE